MLPRAERIGTTEFRRAFEHGRVLRGGLLQLRFYRRESAIEYSIGARKGENKLLRAAFVVSRKTGKATVRNSLRRRVREIYRLSAWRGDARLAGIDLLFFASPAALTASSEALQRALHELLERAARASQSARPAQAATFAVRARSSTGKTFSSSNSRGKASKEKLVREAPAPRPDVE